MFAGLSLRVGQQVQLSPILRESLGETIGEIPIYSLHRIRTKMKKSPIGLSDELQRLLIETLVEANAQYKDDSGNDWNCLTSSNLVDAIDATDEVLKHHIDGINNLPKELAVQRDKVIEKMHQSREQNILVIQQWFETHFDDLRYDMNGNIPWAVVLRLRRDLGLWIATKSNPFGKDIEEAILDIAHEEGILTDDPEVAWERMGGKVFKNKK